jgi:hypothetical protein
MATTHRRNTALIYHIRYIQLSLKQFEINGGRSKFCRIYLCEIYEITKKDANNYPVSNPKNSNKIINLPSSGSEKAIPVPVSCKVTCLSAIIIAAEIGLQTVI